MMQESTAARELLEAARRLLGLSLEDARSALGGASHTVPGDEYGKLQDLTSIQASGRFPATLYVEAREVRLVRIGPDGLNGVTASALRSQVKSEPVILRSRAGKLARMEVSAEEGVAFSSEGDCVHFVEVFEPCTLRDYESRYYRSPDTFMR